MPRLIHAVGPLALLCLPMSAVSQIDLILTGGSSWDVTAVLEGSVFPIGSYTEMDSATIPLTGTINVTLTPAINPTQLTFNSFTLTTTQPVEFDLDAGPEGVMVQLPSNATITKSGPATSVPVVGGGFASPPMSISMPPYFVNGDGALNNDFPNSVVPVFQIELAGTIDNNGTTVTLIAAIPQQVRTYSGNDGDLTFLHTGDVIASAVVTFGACCMPDGGCIEQTQAACDQSGGTYQGDDSACAGVSCPQPPSPCCLPDGTCQVMPDTDCVAMGGAVGPGTDCGSIVCLVVEVPSTDCPCEIDGDTEQIDVLDLLAFLACWFPSSDGAPCP